MSHQPCSTCDKAREIGERLDKKPWFPDLIKKIQESNKVIAERKKGRTRRYVEKLLRRA